MSKLQKDLDNIDQALIALHRASFQHKNWEALQQAAGISIERASASILKALRHDGAMRPHELACRLGIEAPSITRKLQQLEQDGYISRQPDPDDGRATRIAITRRGLAIIEKFQTARRNKLAALFKDWSEHDRSELVRLLGRLNSELTQQSTSQPTRKEPNA